jgi:hypothetical protein
MKKIISFSLWGGQPIYNVGAIENAKTFHHFYPDFECWFYIHDTSVPKSTIKTLEKIKNVKIIIKSGDLRKCSPEMWRFEPIDNPDVELSISRDTDSRITEREKLALDEWLKSDKLFHIMRDHPHHTFDILAGMFGTRKIPSIPCWKEKISDFKHTKDKGYDQDFLRNYIYPIIKDDAIIHASFHRIEQNCKYFPIKYNNDCHFVGMYVNPDNSLSKPHMRIIKEEVNKLKDKGIVL